MFPSPIRTIFRNESSKLAQLPANLSAADDKAGADPDEVVVVDDDSAVVVTV